MYLNGSWLPNEIKETTGPDFRWGCFSYPELENGTYGLEAGTYSAQCYGINNKSEVADEAFQLVAYLTKGAECASLFADITPDVAQIIQGAILLLVTSERLIALMSGQGKKKKAKAPKAKESEVAAK